VIGGGLLLVAVLLFQAHAKDPSRLNALDRALLYVSGSIERLFEAGARGVGNTWRSYVALTRVQEENDRLRRDNALLRGREAARQRLEAQLDRYRRLLDLREQLEAPIPVVPLAPTAAKVVRHDTIAAHVVAVDVHALFRTARLYLDRGDGEVHPDDAVVALDGVVGRVRRVAGRFCDVELVNDPQSRIDVVVARTGGRGMLRGGGRTDREVALLDYLLRTDESRVGDVLVTSGLGGSFPPNLPVGTISRIDRAASGLFQEVEVTPAVAFGRLQEVLIVPKDPSRDPTRGFPRVGPNHRRRP
jgi:rod shape-determining protein MreC